MATDTKAVHLQPVMSRTIPGRKALQRLLIYFCVGILAIDSVYAYYNGITFLTRDKCVLYLSLGHWGFLFYEYFVELFLLVVVGIFVAALIEKHLFKIGRYLPRNPLAAFAYGSVLPLCACGAVPLVGTMAKQIPFRSVITFLIAAPLLNPYIVVLSVSVLGWQYATLRVVSSMVLAVSAGYFAEWIAGRMSDTGPGFPRGCQLAGHCSRSGGDVYEATFAILKKVFPFILIAGAVGLLVEVVDIESWVNRYQLGDSLLGTVLVILAGVPVYFCNGADVLFLKPLLSHNVLPMSTAMAFSLTSTSVCVTSLVLLFKFLGKKLTLAILASIVVITLAISQGIEMFMTLAPHL